MAEQKQNKALEPHQLAVLQLHLPLDEQLNVKC